MATLEPDASLSAVSSTGELSAPPTHRRLMAVTLFRASRIIPGSAQQPRKDPSQLTVNQSD